MIEYLFQINPILWGEDKQIVIYGVGQEQKRLFHALLQQNTRVEAFCLKENQTIGMERVFGKKIIAIQDLQEEYKDAYVIVSMRSVSEDTELLRRLGIKNIIVENVTSDNIGIIIEGDLD